ncbi:MAG: ABC transporter ATP-binding protein [Rhizobiaceae bacterium]|nr:ABC transporter ATP-binding protein [Rhizobiaceae bacterium]
MTGGLTIDRIDVSYGPRSALRGVSLEVAEREIVALIGSNGAGKTTTLRAIMGLTPPDRGTIRFEGTDITRLAPPAVVKLGITLSPEGRRVFPQMSVEENLQLGAYLKTDTVEIAHTMKRVYAYFPRLLERRGQMAGSLSGGEQQMLAIGRALMTNPSLLVLDEATEGLAPVIRQDIWSAIRTLKAAGQSILVVDKTLSELLPVADRCFVLEKGVTVFEGAPAMLTTELQDRYLGV